MPIHELLEQIVPIARQAGAAVMEVYGRDFEAMAKEDASPLTEADLASHHVIVEGLTNLDPSIPILSEEAKALPFEERKGWTRFWLVDPLDGTKEFIKRNGEFTINIALVEDGSPIMGVVYAPVLDHMYAGIVGKGAWIDENGARRPIHADAYVNGTLKVVASRSHAGPETEAMIEKLRQVAGEVDLVSIGSSLKICLVAAGKAHLYPRLGPTMEWDVAAAQAVAEGSGASVTDANGNPMRYNKENLLNPFFLVSAPGVPSVAI